MVQQRKIVLWKMLPIESSHPVDRHAGCTVSNELERNHGGFWFGSDRFPWLLCVLEVQLSSV